MTERDNGAGERGRISRRRFLKFTGVVVVGAGAGAQVIGCGDGGDGGDEGVVAIPVSGGYLLVDTKKCQGCHSCMLACSLVHEGRTGLSLSGIQIIQSSFEAFPDDLTAVACRQCEQPECVDACPTGAMHADPDSGGVRRVDEETCIGCGSCVRACPHAPSRAVLNPDEQSGKNTIRKCDLCADAPYLCDAGGNPVDGGPGGVQACVQICPVRALTFTTKMPDQENADSYQTNLRDEDWKNLGYQVDD